MARVNEVRLKITADGTQAKQEVKSFASTTTKIIAGLGIGAAAVMAFRGVTSAMRGATAMMRDSIAAFKVQEDAVNRLETALRIQGDAVDELLPKYRAMAAEMQKNSRYGDELIMGQMQLLRTLGVQTEDMERATTATLNLSSALGIDLRAATLLVGKAAVGETGSLSRYGIVIDKNIPKAQKFEAVLNLIENQMGGAAQADINTMTGATAQLSNAWGDLQEVIGSVATVAMPLIRTATEIVYKATDKLREYVDNNRESLKKWATSGAVAVLTGLEQMTRGAQDMARTFENLQAIIIQSTNKTGLLGDAIKTVAIGVGAHVVGAKGMVRAIEEVTGAVIDETKVNRDFSDGIGAIADGFAGAKEKLLEFAAEQVKVSEAADKTGVGAGGGEAKDLGPMLGPSIEDFRQYMIERNEAIEQGNAALRERMEEFGLSQEELQLLQLEREVQAYRDAGLEKELIDQHYAENKASIMEGIAEREREEQEAAQEKERELMDKRLEGIRSLTQGFFTSIGEGQQGLEDLQASIMSNLKGMAAKWLTQKAMMLLSGLMLKKAASSADASSGLASTMPQIYANAFNAVVGIPFVGPAIAPGVAAGAVAAAMAGSAGASAMGAGAGSTMMAEGGVMTKPVVMGEAGAEAYLPLENARAQEKIRNALGGGGLTIGTVNVHASTAEGGEEAARAFSEELDRLIRNRDLALGAA